MRNETNEAVNAVVKDLLRLHAGTDPSISTNMSMLTAIIINIESDLKDCVNELCYQCGKYHTSFEGSCDGCRWLTIKEGFRK